MSSHICGRVLAIASAALLSACKTFSPDGGMGTVATIAGQGLNKDVVRVSSPTDAAYAQTRVAHLLKAPLSADAAVQIALLNNAELQAAYNRLGVADAVAVQASRPPLPSFTYDWVKTSIELDIERQVVASVLQLATWPARSKIAGVRFEQAELRAAEETLRIAAETRKAYYNAVGTRQIMAALSSAKANAEASAELASKLTETGAVNKLDQARRIEQDPKVTYCYFNRGTLHLAMGEYQKAIDDFSKQLEIRTDAKTYSRRGEAYEALGKSTMFCCPGAPITRANKPTPFGMLLSGTRHAS
jgi:tetratricopeptide (TPR) repeat protein